jgi:hypothetical protein
VSSIAYQVGNVWTTPSVAARTATFSRVQVIYSNGLTVVANASKQPLQWQDMVLPQYGWEAKGKGLLAYTALCGHTICDFAQTPGSVFANARNPADLGNTQVNATAGTDDRLNSAGAVVNFGPVQTDGMVSIRADGGQWVLRPYPRSRDFTVLLQTSKFAMPSSVRADGGSVAMLKPIAQGLYWKLPLSGAKSYSWAAVNKGE